MTCTKNQIRLWTVNGTLLAETDLFYSNNFRLLSCTVSELFDWDNENVIITGSSDGIVRVRYIVQAFFQLTFNYAIDYVLYFRNPLLKD